MTTAQLQAMQAGRRRADRERLRNAIDRVRNYERWLRTGSVLRRIPEIPSDADYRIARNAGATRR